VVPTYRVYRLKNNRLASWEDIEAPHDVSAIEEVQRFRGEHHVEIWADRRKLTSFPPASLDQTEAPQSDPEM
jgi:hypothetical protein